MEALFRQNARARGETISNAFVKKLREILPLILSILFSCIKINPYAPILPYGKNQNMGR